MDRIGTNERGLMARLLLVPALFLMLLASARAQAPVADFSAAPTSGCAPLAVSFTDLSANSPIAWFWDFENDGITDASTQNPTHVYTVPGIYSVTLTTVNAFGTGTITKTNLIQVFANPTADAGPNRTVCLGSGATIGGAPTASGGSGPYTYFWSPGTGLNSANVANPVATPTASTTYTVTVTDVNGCTSTDQVLVSVLPTPTANAGPDAAICTGFSTTIGGATAGSGGVPPYTFSWTPATGLSSAGSPNPTASPTSTTQYVLSVADANGCVGRDTVVVTVNPSPNLTIAPAGPVTLCQGDSVILDAGPGYFSYQWSTGETTQRITARSTGTYTAIVANGFGCRDTARVQVTVNPRPAPVITPNRPIARSGSVEFCQGDSVRLDAGPGFIAYNWSTGETARFITVRAAGDYTVTVTDANGCTGTSTPLRVVVFPVPSPVIDPAGPIVLCQGDSAVLDAGSGYTSYHWSTGQTTQRITVRSAGSYTVTVFNGLVCSATSAPVVVTSVPRPTPVVTAGGPTTFCEGDSVVLDAGAGFRAYLWSTGETGRRITVRATGSYMVTVTDANGCTGTSTPVNVTVRPVPAPRIAPGDSVRLCAGSSVVLDAGSGFASYRWSNGATTQTITVTAPGLFRVTVTNGFGCTGVDSARVIGVPNPTPGITGVNHPIPTSGTVEFCEGDSIVLDAGNAGYISYLWSTGETTRRITIRTTSTVTVSVTDTNGCGATSAPVNVRVNPLPTLVVTPAGPIVACQDQPIALDAGPGFTSYEWRRINGANPTAVISSSQILQVTVPGVYVFQVTVRNSSGCSRVSDPISVTLNAKPDVTILSDREPPSFCKGESAHLSVPDIFADYRWIRLDNQGRRVTVGATASLDVRATGRYWVIVTDVNGCRDTSDTVDVIVFPRVPPSVTLTQGSNPHCEGDSVTLDAGNFGYVAYLWSNGETTQTIRVAEPGDYRVIVRDTNGCTDTSAALTVRVIPGPKPVISPAGPIAICSCDSLVLDAGPNFASYLWSTGDTTRRITVRDSGSYVVTVTDAVGGCRGRSAPVQVSVSTPYSALSVPSVVTGAPGETVVVPIRIDSLRNPSPCNLVGFTATLSFNKNLLQPTGLTPSCAGDDLSEECRITVHGRRTGSGNVLARLEFIAMLGDSDRTPIRIESFNWDNCQSADTVLDGEFRLENVCPAGGKRLFYSKGALELKQNRPNPFNPTTEIEYEITEPGRTRLFVSNMLGQTIAVLADDTILPGRYVVTFDAGDIPSGIYLYTLQTPTRLVTRMMQVEK